MERFEELVAWQKARTLTKRIYEVTQIGSFAKDYGLASQIQRASVSIMSKVAEGFERFSAAEFQQYLSVAKASCAELRCQLYIALDIGYISQDVFQQLLQQSEEVGRLLGGLRASVQRRRQTQRN